MKSLSRRRGPKSKTLCEFNDFGFHVLFFRSFVTEDSDSSMWGIPGLCFIMRMEVWWFATPGVSRMVGISWISSNWGLYQWKVSCCHQHGSNYCGKGGWSEASQDWEESIWGHRVLKYSKDALTPEVLAGTPNSCSSAANKKSRTCALKSFDAVFIWFCRGTFHSTLVTDSLIPRCKQIPGAKQHRCT